MKENLERTQVPLGDVTLDCVIQRPPKQPGAIPQPVMNSPSGPILRSFCFSADPPRFAPTQDLTQR
jgi:hypothetical protein